MRFLLLASLLILPHSAYAKEKVKKRNPSSSIGVHCLTVTSVEVSKGQFVLNDDFTVQYSTSTGQIIGLQTIHAALNSNKLNELCIKAEQDSLDAKKVRADWPSLTIKSRRNTSVY